MNAHQRSRPISSSLLKKWLGASLPHGRGSVIHSSASVTFLSRAREQAVLGAVALMLVCLPAARAEKWKMQFFYDKDKSVLNIVDLQFPSAARGVAVGMIREGSHDKPVAVITSDGGANWQTIDLQEDPVSLFFMNESLGWMVGAKNGLWQTTEAGKNWRKVTRMPAQVIRVYFSTERDGWAVGGKKKVLETHDGGLHWTPVAAAAEPPGTPDQSIYTWIAFGPSNLGLITGWNLPQRRELERPEWMEPESATGRRTLPHLSYSLSTNDGGKTWKAGSASLFGEISRVRLGAGGKGLGLIEYANGFRYPSEAYRIDWQAGKSDTLYRDRRFHITDIWLTPDGTAYLAGSLAAGQMRGIVPGKVHVLKSNDWSTWNEMELDYRAVANRVTLAAYGDDNLWLATDTGMILKLTK
jgi:photosystem II stability/assembly factor-like uncharacterized protein